MCRSQGEKMKCVDVKVRGCEHEKVICVDVKMKNEKIRR